MLVDINLLPKKERKNFTLFIIVAVLASILLLGSIYVIFYGNYLIKEEKILSESILRVSENIQLEQERLTAGQEESSIGELKNAVEWAETYPIKAVPVLKHLTSLLPERGYILHYNYSEAGIVHLSVQFDTTREAAQYLQWLTDSEWIAEATISRLGLSDNLDAATNKVLDPKIHHYIPRYIGEFDISLEREKVKEMLNTDQGGDT